MMLVETPSAMLPCSEQEEDSCCIRHLGMVGRMSSAKGETAAVTSSICFALFAFNCAIKKGIPVTIRVTVLEKWVAGAGFHQGSYLGQLIQSHVLHLPDKKAGITLTKSYSVTTIVAVIIQCVPTDIVQLGVGMIHCSNIKDSHIVINPRLRFHNFCTVVWPKGELRFGRYSFIELLISQSKRGEHLSYKRSGADVTLDDVLDSTIILDSIYQTVEAWQKTHILSCVM